MNFTSRQELENRITAERVEQAYDDANDGTINEQALNENIEDANRIVSSILYGKGFNRDDLNNLSRDRSIRRCATEILAQLAGERRVEWLDDNGKGRYDALGVRSKTELRDMAAGDLRITLEATYGKNRTVGGAVSVTVPPFEFSRDPRDPTSKPPGGY